MGKSNRESSIGTRLVKSSKLGMLIRKPRKGLFLSENVDEKKTGWKETER